MRLLRMTTKDTRDALNKFTIRFIPTDVIPTEAEIIGDFTIDGEHSGLRCFLNDVSYDSGKDEYVAHYTTYGCPNR